MKQQLPRVADQFTEKSNVLQTLDHSEYSVGDTRITCRLLRPIRETEDKSCQIILTAEGQTSICIHLESLEDGRKVFSLLTKNEVSLYHVADILDELEIGADISSSVV